MTRTSANDLQRVAESGYALWVRVKAQCLETNPFIREDDEGIEYITCPRCGTEAKTMHYRTLGVEPRATTHSVPVQKCGQCNHLFAFVR